MREIILSNPYWGILLTLGTYLIGIQVQKKTKMTILQPILVSIVLIIATLLIFGISYEEYYAQNSFLAYVVTITAVVLAVPLYRNIHLLKKYALPILCGITAGSVTTMLVAVFACKLMGTDMEILLSMIPKSCTNAIAVEVSPIIGGISSLTIAMVVVTGNLGAIVGPEYLSLVGIRHPVAKGVALGTISHAVGTSRAFKEGEVEGSMSSLAIAIAGTVTALLAPVVTALFV